MRVGSIKPVEPVKPVEQKSEKISSDVLHGLFWDYMSQAMLREAPGEVQDKVDSTAGTVAMDKISVKPLTVHKQCRNCGAFKEMLDSDGLCLDCKINKDKGRNYYD